jgi:hypothetical protein
MFYRARVEYRIDPLGLGRVRVRIPALHDGLKTDELPWAQYVSPLGGGFDSGAFCVPEVGSFVIVAEEGRNTSSLIYFGVIRGVGSNDQRGSFIGDDRELCGEWWNQSRQPEVPVEGYNPERDPSVYVVAKSIKGSCVVLDDSDGSESVRIISQSGSEIGMSNPRKKNRTGRGDARSESVGSDFEYERVYIKTDHARVSCSVDGTIIASNGSSEITMKDDGSVVITNGSSSISLSSSEIRLDSPEISLNTSSLKLATSSENPEKISG